MIPLEPKFNIDAPAFALTNTRQSTDTNDSTSCTNRTHSKTLAISTASSLLPLLYPESDSYSTLTQLKTSQNIEPLRQLVSSIAPTTPAPKNYLDYLNTTISDKIEEIYNNTNFFLNASIADLVDTIANTPSPFTIKTIQFVGSIVTHAIGPKGMINFIKSHNLSLTDKSTPTAWKEDEFPYPSDIDMRIHVELNFEIQDPLMGVNYWIQQSINKFLSEKIKSSQSTFESLLSESLFKIESSIINIPNEEKKWVFVKFNHPDKRHRLDLMIILSMPRKAMYPCHDLCFEKTFIKQKKETFNLEKTVKVESLKKWSIKAPHWGNLNQSLIEACTRVVNLRSENLDPRQLDAKAWPHLAVLSAVKGYKILFSDSLREIYAQTIVDPEKFLKDVINPYMTENQTAVFASVIQNFIHKVQMDPRLASETFNLWNSYKNDNNFLLSHHSLSLTATALTKIIETPDFNIGHLIAIGELIGRLFPNSGEWTIDDQCDNSKISFTLSLDSKFGSPRIVIPCYLDGYILGTLLKRIPEKTMAVEKSHPKTISETIPEIIPSPGTPLSGPTPNTSQISQTSLSMPLPESLPDIPLKPLLSAFLTNHSISTMIIDTHLNSLLSSKIISHHSISRQIIEFLHSNGQKVNIQPQNLLPLAESINLSQTSHLWCDIFPHCFGAIVTDRSPIKLTHFKNKSYSPFEGLLLDFAASSHGVLHTQASTTAPQNLHQELIQIFWKSCPARAIALMKRNQVNDLDLLLQTLQNTQTQIHSHLQPPQNHKTHQTGQSSQIYQQLPLAIKRALKPIAESLFSQILPLPQLIEESTLKKIRSLITHPHVEKFYQSIQHSRHFKRILFSEKSTEVKLITFCTQILIDQKRLSDAFDVLLHHHITLPKIWDSLSLLLSETEQIPSTIIEEFINQSKFGRLVTPNKKLINQSLELIYSLPAPPANINHLLSTLSFFEIWQLLLKCPSEKIPSHISALNSIVGIIVNELHPQENFTAKNAKNESFGLTTNSITSSSSSSSSSSSTTLTPSTLPIPPSEIIPSLSPSEVELLLLIQSKISSNLTSQFSEFISILGLKHHSQKLYNNTSVSQPIKYGCSNETLEFLIKTPQHWFKDSLSRILLENLIKAYPLTDLPPLDSSNYSSETLYDLISLLKKHNNLHISVVSQLLTCAVNAKISEKTAQKIIDLFLDIADHILTEEVSNKIRDQAQNWQQLISIAGKIPQKHCIAFLENKGPLPIIFSEHSNSLITVINSTYPIFLKKNHKHTHLIPNLFNQVAKLDFNKFANNSFNHFSELTNALFLIFKEIPLNDSVPESLINTIIKLLATKKIPIDVNWKFTLLEIFCKNSLTQKNNASWVILKESIEKDPCFNKIENVFNFIENCFKIRSRFNSEVGIMLLNIMKNGTNSLIDKNITPKKSEFEQAHRIFNVFILASPNKILRSEIHKSWINWTTKLDKHSNNANLERLEYLTAALNHAFRESEPCIFEIAEYFYYGISEIRKCETLIHKIKIPIVVVQELYAVMHVSYFLIYFSSDRGDTKKSTLIQAFENYIKNCSLWKNLSKHQKLEFDKYLLDYSLGIAITPELQTSLLITSTSIFTDIVLEQQDFASDYDKFIDFRNLLWAYIEKFVRVERPKGLFKMSLSPVSGKIAITREGGGEELDDEEISKVLLLNEKEEKVKTPEDSFTEPNHQSESPPNSKSARDSESTPNSKSAPQSESTPSSPSEPSVPRTLPKPSEPSEPPTLPTPHTLCSPSTETKDSTIEEFEKFIDGEIEQLKQYNQWNLCFNELIIIQQIERTQIVKNLFTGSEAVYIEYLIKNATEDQKEQLINPIKHIINEIYIFNDFQTEGLLPISVISKATSIINFAAQHGCFDNNKELICELQSVVFPADFEIKFFKNPAEVFFRLINNAIDHKNFLSLRWTQLFINNHLNRLYCHLSLESPLDLAFFFNQVKELYRKTDQTNNVNIDKQLFEIQKTIATYFIALKHRKQNQFDDLVTDVLNSITECSKIKSSEMK